MIQQHKRPKFVVTYFPDERYKYTCRMCLKEIEFRGAYNVCGLRKINNFYNHTVCSEECVTMFILANS